MVQWVPPSFAIFIIGLILHFTAIPMNPDLYSLSFLLLTGGICGIMAAGFYAWVDISGSASFLWTPFMHVGMNAITMYLLAEGGIVTWVLSWFYWGDSERSLVNLFWPTGVYWGDSNDDQPPAPREDVPTLLWTLGYIALWMVVARIMFNRKIFIVI